MEQIRQILAQMELNLQLNVAMCDMIDDHEKRIKALEIHQDAMDLKYKGLQRSTSELYYVVSSQKADERRQSEKEAREQSALEARKKAEQLRQMAEESKK